jgi:hypothetical protein
MSLTPVKRSDPFDFPKSMVPVGMTYQWNAKKVLGEVQESYFRMLADGWVPVPAKWHPNKPPPEFRRIGDDKTAARIVETSPIIVEKPQPVTVTQVVIVRRVARRLWLRWLFDLISKETCS